MATILVVEDDPISQRVLIYRLTREGHAVIPAGNGREALARLSETWVDLVITDLAMPKMDGLTLLKHLRADVRFRALPIVVLTASGQDEDRRIAWAEGASEVLAKPTGSRDLLGVINALLS